MRLTVNFALIISLLFLPCILPAVENGPGMVANYSITSPSYILVEKDTFRIITGKDYHRRLPPASTTKVMTTLLALERLSGEEIIIPDQNVVAIPRSKMNLVPGKQYRSADLMKGTMVESANDAAYTLARHIAGSETSFARMMTERAREIGAIDTNFENASGLPADNQYTTPYDLALIFRQALAIDRFIELVQTRYFLFEDSARKVRYKNHNRLLFCFEPAIGGKTGYTRAARHTYVGAFEKNGKVYILAMLGSQKLWSDSVQILKTVYEDVPTDEQLRLAKATTVAYSSVITAKKKTKTSRKKTARHSPSKTKKRYAKK
ncbi:MAG: D-alanyl-D-alanine carboxypeptidase family protein [Syntrophorhabdaceae bacterium]